jgi:hypothetical protein
MNEPEVKHIDKTRNERQRRRRAREKEWLKQHGYESWEALHTQLMNNSLIVQKRTNKKQTPLS